MYTIVRYPTELIDPSEIVVKNFRYLKDATKELYADWCDYCRIEKEESAIPIKSSGCDGDFAYLKYENGDIVWWHIVDAESGDVPEKPKDIFGPNVSVNLFSRKTGNAHSLSNKFENPMDLLEIVYQCPKDDIEILWAAIKKRYPHLVITNPLQICDYYRFIIEDHLGNEYVLVIRGGGK